jgi:GH24 family phage-related lysozyme (muramidase)
MQKLKTLYLTGLSSGTWKSSDTSVATVVNGFVYGVKAGTATITCTSGTKKMVWNVTVKSAAPVKFAYATPNVVSAGSKVTFVAVTDTARNSVQFEVNGKTVLVTDYTTETTAATTTGFAKTTSRIWKYTTSFPEAGTYTATIRSSAKADGSSMSSSYLTTDAFVVSTQNTTTSSVEARRISDEGLEVIASWEGYAAAVYLDPLTSTVVPTVGYGYTFSSGASFYNNLTKTEAWALLCSVVNNGNYTKQVNEFITKNNIRANQCQFDAMVSFSYNIGSGYWNGTAAFDLRLLLFNSVNPNSVQAKIDAGEKVTGTTSLKTTVYSSESRSSKTTATLDAGTSVTIKAATWDSTNKAAWYKITTGSVTGYVPASYISITSHTFAKNLNYTDAISFGSEILEWHHAGGGTCYAGLVYRRLGEAKLFSFGKYDAAKNNSSEKGKNTYNYIVPSCISSKGWLT